MTFFGLELRGLPSSIIVMGVSVSSGFEEGYSQLSERWSGLSDMIQCLFLLYPEAFSMGWSPASRSSSHALFMKAGWMQVKLAN